MITGSSCMEMIYRGHIPSETEFACNSAHAYGQHLATADFRNSCPGGWQLEEQMMQNSLGKGLGGLLGGQRVSAGLEGISRTLLGF